MRLKKIVVAPDSFKGCLSALEVAGCFVRGISKVCPSVEVVSIPLADGGEGTVDALAGFFGGGKIRCRVSDPLMRPVTAGYAMSADGGSAVMEMAQASGLPLLGEDERDPMLTSTYGVGEMIMDALRRGCRHIFMGLGGSATTDGGMGMLAALGFRFKDAYGNLLVGRGMDLCRVTEIAADGVSPLLEGVTFTVACDVDNPFFGNNGAAFVFAPQKGAGRESVEILDRGLRNFAGVIKSSLGVDISNIPGSGAAGGLGGAFVAFLEASLRRGVDMVLDAVSFDEQIDNASLILTGEGSIDRQSLMGKVLSGVLSRGKRRCIPVIAFGGSVSDPDILQESGLTAVSVMQGPLSLKEAMDPAVAIRNIETAVSQTIRIICLS